MASPALAAVLERLNFQEEELNSTRNQVSVIFEAELRVAEDKAATAAAAAATAAAAAATAAAIAATAATAAAAAAAAAAATAAVEAAATSSFHDLSGLAVRLNKRESPNINKLSDVKRSKSGMYELFFLLLFPLYFIVLVLPHLCHCFSLCLPLDFLSLISTLIPSDNTSAHINNSKSSCLSSLLFLPLFSYISPPLIFASPPLTSLLLLHLSFYLSPFSSLLSPLSFYLSPFTSLLLPLSFLLSCFCLSSSYCAFLDH